MQLYPIELDHSQLLIDKIIEALDEAVQAGMTPEEAARDGLITIGAMLERTRGPLAAPEMFARVALTWRDEPVNRQVRVKH